MALYDYDRKLKATEDRIRSANYSESHKELFFKFERSLFLEGLKKPRVLKYLTQLHVIGQWCDFDFKCATRENVEHIMEMVAKAEISDLTKHDYEITVKRFFRWLNDGVDPDITKWIRRRVKNPTKLPEELLTETDVFQMIEAADHPRDKAIIAIFWDAGGRTGEIGELKIKHVVFDKHGAVATVDGKTGMRRVRLVFCVPYLAAWLDIHPHKRNPDAYLWVGIGIKGRGKQLDYPSLRMVIKRISKKAGIRKRVYNHLFRHSRSTDLAQYLTESQMKEHLGWVQGSNMPQTYVHLSGKQIDNAILKIHGIVKEEDTMPQLTSTLCPRCRLNGPTSTFCSRCGMALRVDVVVDVEKEPEIAKILRESV